VPRSPEANERFLEDILGIGQRSYMLPGKQQERSTVFLKPSFPFVGVRHHAIIPVPPSNKTPPNGNTDLVEKEKGKIFPRLATSLTQQYAAASSRCS